MAISIRYNRGSELERDFLIPGKLNISPLPEVGDQGENGTSVFFTNLELNNDFNKDTIIRKILNKEILDSTRTEPIDREYIDGDLILTPSYNVYRIHITSDIEETINIEKVGTISNPRISKDPIRIISNFINSSRIRLSFSFASPTTKYGTIPNYFYYFDNAERPLPDASVDPSIISSDSSGLRSVKNDVLNGRVDGSLNYERYCFEFKSAFSTKVPEQVTECLDDYNVFLKLFFKSNKKYSSSESAYDRNVFVKNENGIDFYKTLTVPIDSSVTMEISQLDNVLIQNSGYSSKYYYPSNSGFWPSYYQTIINVVVSHYDLLDETKVIINCRRKDPEYQYSSEILPRFEGYSTPCVIAKKGTNFEERYASRGFNGERNVAFSPESSNINVFRSGDSAYASRLLYAHASNETDYSTGGTDTYNTNDPDKLMDVLNFLRNNENKTTEKAETSVYSTVNAIFEPLLNSVEMILINKNTGEKFIYCFPNDRIIIQN